MTQNQSKNVKLAILSALALGLLATRMYCQPPAPQLTTADKIAIQTCEKAKQEAQQQFDAANGQELTVFREWQANHPGWAINPKTFAIEAEKKAATTKPDPTKASANEAPKENK